MGFDVSEGMAEVQTAIFTLLDGDATLSGLASGGVHDTVPQNTDYPYVTIGEATEDMEDTFTDGLTEITFTIHTWSRYKENSEAFSIQARIQKLLHRQSLTLATLHHISTLRGYRQIIKDPDGVTKHGVQQFAIRVQSA